METIQILIYFYGNEKKKINCKGMMEITGDNFHPSVGIPMGMGTEEKIPSRHFRDRDREYTPRLPSPRL